MCFILLCLPIVVAANSVPNEYRIKAVFIYNFAQFIEWPETSFANKDAPIVIGILGDDPFGDYLDEIILDEFINGHPLEVRRYKKVDDVTECHILFISKSEIKKLATIFSDLKVKNVLTVGDTENFIQQGGVLRFLIENGKIRMQINLEAAEESQLKISSKLLGVADIISIEK